MLTFLGFLRLSIWFDLRNLTEGKERREKKLVHMIARNSKKMNRKFYHTRASVLQHELGVMLLGC